jgi:hypothetical protein
MQESDLEVKEDFAYLTSFLPDQWQAKAKELGALRRCRKIPNAEILLRVLLIHLAEGCSLRETAVRARQGNLVDLSDVAIMDRLRRSGEWFRWMNTEIMKRWVVQQPTTVFGPKWNVCVVDGTHVKEPGPTGSSWRIHYCVGLPSLACRELQVSDQKGDGESLKRFAVEAGDLFIGDRAYGVRPGIFHVTRKGGDVLVRFVINNLPMSTEEGCPFDMLTHLRRLSGTEIGDWPVWLHGKEGAIEGRVCAIKKSRQAAEKARRQAIRKAQKNGSKIQPETLEAAGYTFVFTTVRREDLSPTNVLEMYRGRWQIELVFKRLKSIVGLGHLRKIDKQSAIAWLQGKLLVAFLIELLLRHAEAFFPWGYPLRQASMSQPLPMAGGTTYAPLAAENGQSGS